MAKDEWLKAADSEFQSLLRAVDGLNDDQMKSIWYGDWGVREIFIHLAGWHREMTPALEHISRGERPNPDGHDYSTFDGWNANFVEANKDLSPARAVGELKASKQEFMAAARTVPDERFEEGRAAHRILLAA